MHEKVFMDHKCKERDRLEELKSPRGQTAYSFYGEWMRLKKRSVPKIETFSVSRQYNYFIRFVDWVNKLAIPNPKVFIKLMVDSDTDPVLWCRNNTYALYLQWYDDVISPETQFIETMETLQKLALDHGVPNSSIYATLGAPRIAKMIRKRQLSPWLLVTSKRFLEWAMALEVDERDEVTTAVNIPAFAEKLNQKPGLAKEFQLACQQENL